MKSKLEKMRKKKENPIARFSYRIISERVTPIIAKTGITPNQISLISIITAFISGIFFALGTWEYLLLAFVFLQITYLLDHVDGNLARYTGNCTVFGRWIDRIANNLFKFFFLFGATIGVFRTTNNAFYLILGCIGIFNWIFSTYVSETKGMFTFKKSLSLLPESEKSSVPLSLISFNLLGLFALINKVNYALWFFAIFGLVWIKQIYDIHKQWKRESAK